MAGLELQQSREESLERVGMVESRCFEYLSEGHSSAHRSYPSREDQP
jgi:hypothetical protein